MQEGPARVVLAPCLPRALLAGLVAAVSAASVLVSVSVFDASHAARQDPVGGHLHPIAAAAPISRTIVGPLAAAADGQNARLEVLLPLSEYDSRADVPLSPGVPVGEKVIVRLQASDPITGAPLANVAPTFQVDALGAAGSDPGGSVPVGIHERLVLHGSSGALDFSGATSQTAEPDHATLELPGPSGEAALDGLNRFVFVTLPDNDQVAVVDTLTRSLVDAVSTGAHPFHIRTEPSAQHVWVANDGSDSVSAIDVDTHAQRTTGVGSGNHNLAFSDDGSLVFVSNSADSSVSVVDAQAVRSVGELSVGQTPAGLYYSAATHRLYVANAGSGTISMFDRRGADELVAAGTIVTGAGTTAVFIDPSGRIGVASNRGANTLTVFRPDTGEVVRTIPAGLEPEEISVLHAGPDGDYALVGNATSGTVTYVSLTNLERFGEIAVRESSALDSAAGGGPVTVYVDDASGEALVPDPEAGRIHVIRIVGHQPVVTEDVPVAIGGDGVLSLATRVQAAGPGLFQWVVRFDHEGAYQLNVGLGPRQTMLQFPVQVGVVRVLKSWLVAAIAPTEPGRAGEATLVRYRITDRQTGEPLTSLSDGLISVSQSAANGSETVAWKRVVEAREVGPGLYEARVVLPAPGAYSTAFESSAAGLGAQDAEVGRLNAP